MANEFRTIKQIGSCEIVGPVKLPLILHTGKVAKFTLHYFSFPRGRYEVLSEGLIEGAENPLVRIQSACKWGMEFGSQHCDCRWQFERAKELIATEGVGLLIYAYDHAGKGIGLRNHSLVYAEGQARGLELVVDAYVQLGFREDYRDYDDIIAILKYLGIARLRLLTNDPKRIRLLREAGIETTQISLQQTFNENPIITAEYEAKVAKLGHILTLK